MLSPAFLLPVSSVTIAAGIAGATFLHFDGYSSESRWALSLGGRIVLLLAPALLFLALILLVRPSRRMASVVACAAGALASAAMIYGLTARPRHGGFLADLGVLLDSLLLNFVALELLFLPLVFARPRLWPFAAQTLFMSGIIIAVTLGGWGAGVALWSRTVPLRIIAAAELAAEGRPYCLMTGRRAVLSRDDLTAIAMLPPHEHGMSSDFHAVMVLDEPLGFKNWSYSSGSFQDFKAGSFPEITRRDRLCKPKRHFAAAL